MEPDSNDPSVDQAIIQALDQLTPEPISPEVAAAASRDRALVDFERTLPERREADRIAAEEAAKAAQRGLSEEVTLQARAACVVFLTALLAVMAVVGVFLSSERSAMRRADADLFGALSDQAAQAIIGHSDAAHGDLSGHAFDAIQSEVALLAEMKGVRQVALFFADGQDVLSARSSEAVETSGGDLPLPAVAGPGRWLRKDHLMVARGFRMRSSDQEDATLVVEAGYPGLDRRMRDLVALSGRVVGLTAILLVFLVPLLSRWLLSGLVHSANLARSGKRVTVQDVHGCGSEVVDLVRRLESEQLRISALERSSAGIVESAREHIQSLRDLRSESDRAADAARKEARAATAAKAAFVANTSHEVRTPLHAVLGANALLLQTDLDAEQIALAERSMRASEMLLSLVDDVLDLARFDAREIKLAQDTFDPGKLVEEVAELSAPLAATKGLEVTVYVSPSCPTSLVGDPARIRQALMRLMDNAVKFTESGEICVDLAWEMGEDNLPRAIFSVADTGLGIGDEERARLFRAFEQLDTSNTRRHGGVGLGLALVARIARAAGGEVRLESRRGRGSTFHLALPLLVDAEEARRITRGERPTETPLAGMTILVLDDSPLASRTIGQTLRDLGAVAHVESSTYAGFENLLRSDIDVVLLDSLLAGRDAFLGAIESNETREPKPVILMTPAHASRLTQESRDEAVTAMVAKPLLRESLVMVLKRVLEPAVDPVAAKAEAQKVAHATSQQDLLDSQLRQRVRILLVEDNHTNQQLVQYILGKRGYQVDVASNGRRAVDACAVGEYDAILMDCQMPEMDGYEATCRIRALEAPRGRRTPILAMTASILESDRDRCLTAGMDDMIGKPFQPHRMVQWLETWLSRSVYNEDGTAPAKQRVTRSQVEEELAQRSGAQGTSGGPSAAELEKRRAEEEALERSIDGALDRDVLGALLEDEEGRVLASELIDGFLEITPEKLRQMEHAVEAGDLSACAMIAHGLVSTSGTVGAIRLALMLRDIERFARGGNSIDSARIVAGCRGEVELAKRALHKAIAAG
ncbi:MAG: signal transduction histidine kinase/CheY-like chemotaxis protein [Planctomycetota bacterium]|jgi:signal transduction histidine kinase/CheY-like chemotaxis protein